MEEMPKIFCDIELQVYLAIWWGDNSSKHFSELRKISESGRQLVDVDYLQ